MRVKKIELKRYYPYKEPLCNIEFRENSRLVSLCQAIAAQPQNTKAWVKMVRDMDKKYPPTPVTMEHLRTAWDILEEEMEGKTTLEETLEVAYALESVSDKQISNIGYNLRAAIANFLYNKKKLSEREEDMLEAAQERNEKRWV